MTTAPNLPPPCPDEIIGEHASPLSMLDKDEWRDVYIRFKPNASEAEYDRAWDEFQEAKRMRGMH